MTFFKEDITIHRMNSEKLSVTCSSDNHEDCCKVSSKRGYEVKSKTPSI